MKAGRKTKNQMSNDLYEDLETYQETHIPSENNMDIEKPNNKHEEDLDSEFDDSMDIEPEQILNEGKKKTDKVADAVNQLRERANMPDLPIGLSQDSMRNRIHNERAVELAFEEHRWWDILRWKQGAQLVAQPMKAMNVPNHQPPYGYTVINLPTQYQKVFYDKMYFYPIPTIELQKSNGILKQTPGW